MTKMDDARAKMIIEAVLRGDGVWAETLRRALGHALQAIEDRASLLETSEVPDMGVAWSSARRAARDHMAGKIVR